MEIISYSILITPDHHVFLVVPTTRMDLSLPPSARPQMPLYLPTRLPPSPAIFVGPAHLLLLDAKEKTVYENCTVSIPTLVRRV